MRYEMDVVQVLIVKLREGDGRHRFFQGLSLSSARFLDAFISGTLLVSCNYLPFYIIVILSFSFPSGATELNPILLLPHNRHKQTNKHVHPPLGPQDSQGPDSSAIRPQDRNDGVREPYCNW